jgi:hypothetical protein
LEYEKEITKMNRCRADPKRGRIRLKTSFFNTLRKDFSPCSPNSSFHSSEDSPPEASLPGGRAALFSLLLDRVVEVPSPGIEFDFLSYYDYPLDDQEIILNASGPLGRGEALDERRGIGSSVWLSNRLSFLRRKR